MTERDEWDDAVDNAIDCLIDDSTEAFTLVAIKENGAFDMVEYAGSQDMLLAVFATIESVRESARNDGVELSPLDVFQATQYHVMTEGYERGFSEREEFGR